MRNVRKYGRQPFNIAVIHGGPGAPGEMTTVARKLSSLKGILEPLQTARTPEGQAHELKTVLAKNGDIPVTLVGFSWGAMLSFMVAAQHPSLVRKLILISSAPYEEKYAANIMETRLSRLSDEEKQAALSLMKTLEDPDAKDKNTLMARFGMLMFKVDSYYPLSDNSEILAYQYDIYRSVWEKARELRRQGQLLELARRIRCPVVAIHGNYDAHPAEGVKEPLSYLLKDFRFVLLEKCGHYPWLEHEARDRFYRILKDEVK